MQHVIFFYLILCFSVLLGSVFVFSVFYSKYRLLIIKYYIILILLFVGRFFIFMHSYYLELIIHAGIYHKISNVIFRFIWGSMFLLFFPKFCLSLIEKKLSSLEKGIIIVIFSMQYLFIIVSFSLYRSLSDLYATLEFLYVTVNNCLFTVYIFFILIYGFIHYKKFKNILKKKLVKINMILGIILFPILIIDMLETKGITNFLPEGLLLIYIFSAGYSITNIKLFYDYFIKRIMISTPLEKIPESFIKVNRITERENDIIRLLMEDYTYRKIAHSLFISERTVECHISNIYKKSNVKNKSELIELLKVFHSIN